MLNNTFKEEKHKEKTKKLKKTSNKFLYSFLTIFFVGYIFFFTSSLWLPKSYTGVNVTPIGTPTKANNRVVTIDRWVYSPDEKAMEIIIEMENNSVDGISEYTWQLKDKNGLIKTEVIGEADLFTVVRGIGIKRGWAEVSLTIDAKEDEEDSFSPIVIYMNDKTSQVVEGLETLDMAAYKILAYESKIEGYNLIIEEKGLEIEDKNSEIGEIVNRIKELEERQLHQTEKERESTSSLITSLSSQKERLLKEIEDIEKVINEYREKISLQESILDELKWF